MIVCRHLHYGISCYNLNFTKNLLTFIPPQIPSYSQCSGKILNCTNSSLANKIWRFAAFE